MRTKTLYRCDAQKIDISRFPNFHITGSITGMKKLYYGKNALLVRCGSWIYNVSSEPEVYGTCGKDRVSDDGTGTGRFYEGLLKPRGTCA